MSELSTDGKLEVRYHFVRDSKQMIEAAEALHLAPHTLLPLDLLRNDLQRDVCLRR